MTTVPFYLRGLWGSSFSRADSFYKNLTKRQGKREILVAFGKPIYGFIDATAMKQKVLELSFSVWEKVMSKRKPLMHHWLNSAKSNLFKEAAVDAQGTKLNNLKFIAAVLMFVKILKAALGNEKMSACYYQVHQSEQLLI